MQTFLGIDIGTSGCKLALFGEDGGLLCDASEEYETYYPAPGFAEQEPEAWWLAVCRGLKRLWERGGSPSGVAAIAIDGQGWSAIPVDGEGNVLARTPIWMDTRAADVCGTWEKRLSRERLFAVSGNPFSPTYTLPKVLHWMERSPELIKNSSRILQSNSFIAYRLTGAASMDISMSYGWQNFSQTSLRYDDALTKEFGIPARFLIEPVASEALVGRVTESAAKLTGLLSGTPVVAGGLDAACGTLGAGVVEPGQTQEQGGQAGGMSICVDTPRAHPKLILGAHVVPDMWLLQGGTVGGGASLKWFVSQLGAERFAEKNLERESADVFRLLDAEAEQSPVGSNGLVFLPYLSGERSPIWDSKASGMYFGLTYSSKHADFVRAAMEGVAYSLRHNIETAEEAGVIVSELRGTGGSANSRIWVQIKADATGIPFSIPSSDSATTRGAAMLAMVGAGLFGSCQEAAKAIVRVKRVQEPKSENNKIYDKFYNLYKQLYTCNSECMARLHDIKGGAL